VADKVYVRSLVEDTRSIFEVAECASAADPQDFALLVQPDGGLHFVMDTPFSLDAAASYTGAHSAFHIVRNESGVHVLGQNAGERCVIERRCSPRELLRDQPLYRITSPLLTSGAASS